MFQSARFKLTLFYLAAVLAVSLTMSLGTRMLAQYEYERSNIAQRGAFRGIIYKLYDLPRPISDDAFAFQQLQQERVRHKLNAYVLWINLGALIIGGVGSYWFAGRTLRPIEEAHEAQKRFASDASHELRTPLTAMKVENEVFLRQKDFSTHEARDLIKSNLEEVDRLERLASNLLALTKFETARLELVPTDITSIVADARFQLEKIHPDVQIATDIQEGRVLAHQESAVQLVSIILDNARKYNAPDAPITITGSRVDNQYALAIDDQGPGIAEEDLPYIFDRLYRGDKARSSNVPGHGLGLALAQRIARANHADIVAANRPEGGARFTVTFQALKQPSAS